MTEHVKLEIPFNYDIPLIIGGLPFMIEEAGGTVTIQREEERTITVGN